MNLSPSLLFLGLALTTALVLGSACTDSAIPEGNGQGVRQGMIDQEQLLGAWNLVELGGEPIPSDLSANVEFRSDGGVSGHSGVNRMSGTWTLEKDRLSFGPIATTRMAGPPEAMKLEARVLEALDRVAKATLDKNGRLQFHSAAGDLLSIAEPKPR